MELGEQKEQQQRGYQNDDKHKILRYIMTPLLFPMN